MRWPSAGIDYSHLKELAPTTELRQLQYREDDRRGEGKRSRTVLAPEYADGYTEEILDRVDLAPIVKWIGELKGRPALRRARPGGLPPLAGRGPPAARLGLQRRGSASAASGPLTGGVISATGSERPAERRRVAIRRPG